MKTLKGLILFSLISLKISSCSLPEPVEPNYVALAAELLPEIQQNTATYNGMDIGRFQLIWMQQLGGVAGFDLEVDRYAMAPNMVENSWFNYYSIIHPRIISMIAYASEAGAPAYLGIGRLLLAINMQLITDTWGDVPYEHAFGYAQNLTFIPYNTQQQVYGYLIQLTDLAIDDIQKAINDTSPRPQANDHFYGGNLEKWLKAANMFKARVKLRLAHKNNDYSNLAEFFQEATLFSGNDDNMRFTYFGNQQNPYFFNDNVTRNSRVGNHFIGMLKATNDPRLPVFVRPTGSPAQFLGTNPGEGNAQASFIGANVASQTSPTFLLTFVEQKFIEAEVMLRVGQQLLADQAFQQAVKASLAMFNVSNPTWEAQHAELTNVTLQDIIHAKYIALFLNPEVWSDYRRTGFPQLTPFQGQSIPRRFLYPAREITLNAMNTPLGVTIFSRVWWDKL